VCTCLCALVREAQYTFDDDDYDDDDRYDYDGLALKCVVRDSFNVLPQLSSAIIINLDPCEFSHAFKRLPFAEKPYFCLFTKFTQENKDDRTDKEVNE